jgi:hypothetical protein
MQIKRAMLTASACVLFIGIARGEDDPRKGQPITIIAGAETLKAGSRCVVEMNPSTTGRNATVTTYEGEITKATSEGVGLAVAETRLTVTRQTPLARAPFFDRLFRNVGIGRPGPDAGTEVWLPSAKIRSVKLTGGKADNQTEPQIKPASFRNASR